MLRLLSSNDVRQAITMCEAIEIMKSVFRQLSLGKSNVPLRTSISTPSGVTLVMPAYLPESQALGVKLASIYPNNVEQGLPTLEGLVAVLDPQTGRPVAALDAAYLTALRTGATSGLATDLLARKDAHILTVFGAGIQARTHIEAICSIRKIQGIRLFSRTEASAERLAKELAQARRAIAVTLARNPSEALKGSNIIVCATSSSKPVFNGSDLTSGVHINAIGSFRPDVQEIDECTAQRARVVVDQRMTALSEAGDLIIPIRKGVITETHIQAELGEIVIGKKKGRVSDDDITLFKSVGNAAQDIAIAQAVLKSAEANNLGILVPF
jgi:ornithine cyclodeaminase